MRSVLRIVVVATVLATFWSRGSTSKWQSWRSAQKRTDLGVLQAMAHRIRPGMTYGEVVYVLGRADGSASDRSGSGVWVYRIAQSRIRFYVTFDQGRVEEVQVIDFDLPGPTSYSVADFWPK